LHPEIFAIKKLIAEECKIHNNSNRMNVEPGYENFLAFIDMHGHSRKKNVFMYGPEFPIHDTRYLSMRIIPKLMSENSELFRFFSCNFRIHPSKESTARVVLWREFNITNCYTLESSF
jgi:cytosolic carboxypeptidase protein 2/3